MAKKLVYNYTFDASAKTIKFGGLFKLRTIQMVTNVTDNIIIYNFADSTKGGTASYDGDNDETTITLTYDTTSMSDSDELQIFVDITEDQIEFGETFIDPVSKLRVSNPENLIDTDFEYGLQPTKWETVELVNNIPSSYTRAPGVSIGGIAAVNCTSNSETIVVTCSAEHELSVGDPIEVRGLTSRTANGKYLITQVPSPLIFNYKANSVQTITADLKTAYTTIIPGSFFTGSSIEYNKYEGINTDDAVPSTLLVTTDYGHGFSTNTSMYITNTVGKKELIISNTTTSNAPDGTKYIDDVSDSFYIPLHGLYNNQVVTVSAGAGGAVPTTGSTSTGPEGSQDIQAIYDAAETSVETIVTTMKSASDHSRLYMNGPANGMRYCWADINISPGGGGGTITQETELGEYKNTYYFRRNVGSSEYNMARYYQNYNTYSSIETWATGNPVDIGNTIRRNYIYSGNGNSSNWPSSLSNRGYYHQSTPFNRNQYTDFILTVKQYPILTSLNNNLDSTGYTTYDISRYYIINNTDVKSETSYGSRYLFEQQTPQTYNTDWKYTYGVIYYNAGSGETSNYVIDIYLMNTQWTDYYSPTSVTIGPEHHDSLESRHSSSMGPYWHINVQIQLDDGHTSATYNSMSYASSRVSDIVTAVVDAITPASLTSGDDVKVVYVDDNRIKIKKEDTGATYDLTDSGTQPISVTTGQTFGIADDYYDVSDVGITTVALSSNSRLSPRVQSFADSDVSHDTANSRYYINFANGHGIADGQKVTFNRISGTDLPGITDSTLYYAYVPNSKYLSLSADEDDYEVGTTSITGVPGSAGSYTLSIASISGRVAAAGTVTTSTSSNTVTGTDTKFTSVYSIGDNFIMDSLPDNVYDTYKVQKITSIASDTSLILETNAGITTEGSQHFIDTKFNVRADGTFIHRPFDGGVDITAGASPDSKVIRQTRKYFRYQSGKGLQCSMAMNFNPYRQARLVTSSGTTATVTTEYPHGLTNGDTIKVRNVEVSSGTNYYNGTSFTVSNVSAGAPFTFSYTMSGDPDDDTPTGITEYTISSYSNAGIRGGLFDDQNGMFYEYDGSTIYCVRRSSTLQIPGTTTPTFNSNTLIGTNTKFLTNLSTNDMIVIRGQSYKVTRIVDDETIDIQPKYRGTTQNGVIITKTIDLRISQANWSIDTADGNGPSGYNLDINSIQMAYMDYSWYGAGKIRFGFKDTHGHVKYMHEFVHNNKLNEAYMRTGNVPARYEAFNTGDPTYVPSLFHWGTSVIMDGRYDSDDSYLFTASGNSLSFTNGDADTATTNAAGEIVSVRQSYNTYNYYLRLSFGSADASKFSNGIQLYTVDGELNGQIVDFAKYSGSNYHVHIYLSSGNRNESPAIYPTVANATTINIGAPASGGEAVDLTSTIPLVSLRLAPSVDNNLIGAIGERDVINRMQLKLNEMGISVSHDVRVSVILNGSLSNINYGNVGSPSLSQFVAHDAADTIQDGTTIYQFRASGGSLGSNGERTVATQDFDLSRLIDMGNSILGGDGVFPNGPDIITICATVLDTSTVNKTSPFQVSSRISWSESQA